MNSLRTLVLTGAVTAIALIVATMFAETFAGSKDWPCEPHRGLTPLCADDLGGHAILSPEDIVGLPDSDWLVVSEFGRKDILGRLTALNESSLETRVLDWSFDRDMAFPEDCEAPDPARFQPHGIDLSRDGRRLLVVNHYPQDRVEVFDVAPSTDDLGFELTWKGCVPYYQPGDYRLNDVVAFGQTGLITTRMTSSAWYSYIMLFFGLRNGWVDEWTPEEGWAQIEKSRSVFPNGIHISPDEKSLFVASYGEKKVYKIDLETGKRSNSKRLSIWVDNLSWSQDGSRLLATGQRAWHITALKCQMVTVGNCDQPYAVVALDPESLEAETVLVRDPVVVYGGGTVAFERGDVMWIGSHQSDRIAKFDLNERID